MKLETKLGMGTGLLIFAMLLSAFTAHLGIQKANALATQITQTRLPVLLAIREARVHIVGSIIALQSELLGSTRVELHGERTLHTLAAQQAMAQLEVLKPALTPQDAQQVAVLQEDIARLTLLQTKAETLAATNPAQARALLEDDILPLERAAYNIAGDLSASQSTSAAADSAELRHTNHATLVTLWLLTLVGAIAGGLVSAFFGRHIAVAIESVASRANSIAAGDLTGTPLNLDTRDQVGSLAEAMNRMQTALAGIIGTVADTAGSLTGSAACMRTASDQIHRRIDQQSQQTQQAATAMQEMSASIAEVSRHTQSAAETARSAAQTAREGGAIVKDMLTSMQQIATAVSDTSETVGLLGDDSKRISQIVTVIDEIARKTNLLALNAAIEAARAGDQGRGFAVVAGEVRRLAESTAQATGEIGAMIAGIQLRTRTAIASMASGTGTVREGVATTNQAGEALERIIGMAEQVDRMITQIAIAASQQATAADQSSASLDSIHSLSHDNLTEMTTTAAGIESLRGTAVKLEKQVDRFQVLEHGAPHLKAA